MSFFSCGLQIRVVKGPDKGRTFPLDCREITIGRARNPGDRAPGWVLLNDQKISRVHCDLVWVDEAKAYRLMHRSDTNPTEVNGQAIPEAVLKIGDQVSLGDTTLDVQSADFRFGGVAPERIGHIHEARQKGQAPAANAALAFRDPKKENEAETSTLKADRKIALSKRSQMFLEILGGKQQGQKLPLNGFKIQFGGSKATELPEEQPWWDQEIILAESVLPMRCMAWLWRELENAYEVTLTRDIETPITLERRVDGAEWIAEVPTGSPVFLRAGDLVYVGHTACQLTVELV